ncbi:MAG: STAS domain-containing protein [Lachnospiraceae bacterium]|nr:STAS domain-containing protein [Lachnospiraceae bacterium]
MNIDVKQEGASATVQLEGMLDATSAASFKEALAKIPDSVTSITVDMEKLRYTSSAGLRVILELQNRMDQSGGQVTFANVDENIREVFDDTGFSEFITIV